MTFSYSFFTVHFYGMFDIFIGFCAEFRDFVSFSGRHNRTRTYNHLIRSQGLYPIELYVDEGQAETLTCFANVGFRWRNIVTPRIKW